MKEDGNKADLKGYIPSLSKSWYLVLFTAVSSETSRFSLTCFSVCVLSLPLFFLPEGGKEEEAEEGGREGKGKKKKGQAKNNGDSFLLSLGKNA